jgi:hypothetical protein
MNACKQQGNFIYRANMHSQALDIHGNANCNWAIVNAKVMMLQFTS